MRIKKRMIGFIIAAFLLVLLYVLRVVSINRNAQKTETYTYELGEIVDFENDYVDGMEECIPGYAVQVLGYELVDTRELYQRYHIGEVDDYTLTNTPFYCLLKVRFYNNDSDLGEQGGLMLSRYSLMGDNWMTMISENMFCTMYPDMPGISFSLREGTAMELELPYPITRNEGCTKEDMKIHPPMLEITEYPNRKVLKAGKSD